MVVGASVCEREGVYATLVVPLLHPALSISSRLNTAPLFSQNDLQPAGATALAPSLACLTGLTDLHLRWVP